MILIERLRAGVVGALERASAVLAGEQAGFAKILRDHARFFSLILDAEQQDTATRTGLEKRRALFRLIDSELMAHSRAEREVLYPALVDVRGAREIIRWCIREHDSMERHVGSLRDKDAGSEAFTKELRALRLELERHRLREEGELFEVAQNALPTSRRRALERAYAHARNAARASRGPPS